MQLLPSRPTSYGFDVRALDVVDHQPLPLTLIARRTHSHSIGQGVAGEVTSCGAGYALVEKFVAEEYLEEADPRSNGFEAGPAGA